MADDGEGNSAVNGNLSAEEWLSYAQELVPEALKKAREVTEFSLRWKMIISKIEQIPLRLSELSTHPCFSKNPLCKEQLQAVSGTLNESIELANFCTKQKYEGKLRMQSDVDALSGKLDLNLRDCVLLIKTGVLGEVSVPSIASAEPEDAVVNAALREMLARLQIGHLDSKHRALDSLVEAMKEDEKNVLAVVGRSNIAALVQLLTATPRIREKAVTIICSLVESGSCTDWLVSEGVVPPLIRLAESGSPVGKEKAVIALGKLSVTPDTARLVIGHGGVKSLIEICRTNEPVLQAAAASALKNLSAVPEMRRVLADEGIVGVTIDLLSDAIFPGSKECAAECLNNLTSSSDALRRSVIAEGGFQSLLVYLDEDRSPRESAVSALRNMVPCVSTEFLVRSELIPTLAHVLESGSEAAHQAAASLICQICSTTEMKRLVGEAGCVPFLVMMLEAKTQATIEVAAQGIASLIGVSRNRREVKKDIKSVANLVGLLDSGSSAQKYAIFCLVSLSSSRRCKKLMIAYGAIGYLKKLAETDVHGAKNLLMRLQRGKLRSLLSRK